LISFEALLPLEISVKRDGGVRMDIYEMLMQDHRLIEELFSEIEQTRDEEVEQRELLFTRLQKALENHEIMEENIFYPEIEKYPETKELLAQAFDDHANFDAILQEIREMRTNKGDWLERISELKDVVQRHMREQEDKMFQLARAKLGKSRAEELGRQIQELKQNKIR
jgi:hemerythrin superfamily protein